MAQEFKGKGSHIALGPVVGPLGRSGYGGRNWEGFSPDPYLTGEAVNATIIAMQSTGLQACVKHYIGNEQETQRNPSTENGVTIEAVSSNIDDRTMHELYTWPFANAIRAGVASVMCSYNRINGSYACQNSKTLNGILKEELAFQGYVVSDWGGTHSGVPAIQSGLDMDMPGSIGWSSNSNASYFGGNITIAVNNGSLPISRLNDMILRVMTPYFYLGQDDYPTVDPSSADLEGFVASESPYQWDLSGTKHRDLRDDHASLIRNLGASSATLLKNTNNALPISKPPKVIGVFGNDAADEADGLYQPEDYPANDYGYDIGTLYVGGGSGTGRLSYLVPPLDAIKAWARPSGSLVQYITSNSVAAESVSTIYPIPDVCFVFLKTYVTEGQDRLSFDVDWNGTTVVNTVTKLCNNTIVVTHSGGVNTMPWADNPNVTAIIAAHLPGQETGNSLVDVISGKVNPSGKLPFTIAYNASDYNAPIVNFTGTDEPDAWQSDFTEGLLIDYRHFDASNITPRYEFGFGLSYTTFSLSDLNVVPSGGNVSAFPPTSNVAPGGNPSLYETLAKVTFTVSNTGDVAGATVPQLYIAFPQDTSPSGTPPQVLRGFDKITLSAGESQSLTFSLTRKDLSFWDVVAQDWQIPSGSFGVTLGLSSRDVQADSSISLL